MTEEKFTVLFESQFSVGSNELVFQVKVRPGSTVPLQAARLAWESQRLESSHRLSPVTP